MFNLNDKVVYPGHGVARISRIINKNVADKEVSFYELAFLNKDATVLVPTFNAQSVGLRPLSTQNHVKDVFEIFSTLENNNYQFEFNATNWNKRNKEYQNKLRKGGLKDLLDIYSDLKQISGQKELSFGEKNLLSQTEALLVEEISIIEDLPQEKVIEKLRLLCPIQIQSNSPIKETLI